MQPGEALVVGGNKVPGREGIVRQGQHVAHRDFVGVPFAAVGFSIGFFTPPAPKRFAL